MAYDDQNIFAKILRGEIPSYKVFETEHALAILDAFPAAPGHSLLLCKAPCVNLFDMSSEVAAAYLQELPRLAKMVQAASGAPAVNILQNNGAEAGQEVMHCHFHVLPRQAGDQLLKLPASASAMLAPEAAAALLAKMAPAVAGPEGTPGTDEWKTRCRRAGVPEDCDPAKLAFAEHGTKIRGESTGKLNDDLPSEEEDDGDGMGDFAADIGGGDDY
jgi:diadenosine tetraphosphate (Ap4A) HIT family hydrolase